jgi:site-specific recombinase XerD
MLDNVRAVDGSLATLFAEFEVARRSAKPSLHSERAARSDFAAIHGLLQEAAGTGDVLLEEVTARHLRLAFARFAETHAAASIARCWSTWNQFYGFLVSEELVAGNPMGAVAKPKVGRRTPKPLQGEDAPEALLSSVAAGDRPGRWPWPERDLAFLATALLTGLRLSELIGLNLGSIDGRPGERRIKVLGKGRKERTVPIEEPLHDVIERYMATRRERFPGVKLGPKAPLFVDRRGDRIKRGGAHYLVERSYRAAGLAGRVPAGAMVHALRHTFATRLAEDGATATEIQALLGHESLNTSQGYIDATANATRQAARANRTYRALGRLARERSSRATDRSGDAVLQRFIP